jgi:hypothetical protein
MDAGLALPGADSAEPRDHRSSAKPWPPAGVAADADHRIGRIDAQIGRFDAAAAVRMLPLNQPSPGGPLLHRLRGHCG